MRCKRLWDNRQKAFDCALTSGHRVVNPMSVETATRIRKRCFRTKTLQGRGRKCELWVMALEDDLVLEFDCLRKLVLKFSVQTLPMLVKHVTQESSNEHYREDLNLENNQTIKRNLITTDWVKRFMWQKQYCFSASDR